MMRSKSRLSRPGGDRRRGALVVIVMICLLLVSLIGASMIKLALAQRQQSRQGQLRLQASWLAESATNRAAALLSANPEYDGEEWHLKADEAIDGEPGRVSIEISMNDRLPNRRVVSVVADYPSDTQQRARVSKQVMIDL